jgi:hypothetical protein
MYALRNDLLMIEIESRVFAIKALPNSARKQRIK